MTLTPHWQIFRDADILMYTIKKKKEEERKQEEAVFYFLHGKIPCLRPSYLLAIMDFFSDRMVMYQCLTGLHICLCHMKLDDNFHATYHLFATRE